MSCSAANTDHLRRVGQERGSKRKGEVMRLLLHEPPSPVSGGILGESVNKNQTKGLAASVPPEHPRSRNTKGSWPGL